MGCVSGSTKGPPRTLQILPPEGPAARPPRAELRRSSINDLVDRLAGEVVLRHVPGRRVLDFGHGAPMVTDLVAERASAQTIVDAIDLGRGAEVRVPMPNGTFDVVYCLRTLPHLGKDEATSRSAATSALAEIARLLVPDGTALVQFDNPRSLWGLYHGIRNPITVVERGALIVDSDRGITRFDTLGQFKRMLPESLHLSRLHGLRIAIHIPGLLRLPILGRLLEAAEWRARDRSIFNALGAHLLVELRRIP
jgi:SAM-dependent methyltransferase